MPIYERQFAKECKQIILDQIFSLHRLSMSPHFGSSSSSINPNSKHTLFPTQLSFYRRIGLFSKLVTFQRRPGRQRIQDYGDLWLYYWAGSQRLICSLAKNWPDILQSLCSLVKIGQEGSESKTTEIYGFIIGLEASD